MFKIFLVALIACTIVHAYNYGENQANYGGVPVNNNLNTNLDQSAQQVRSSFIKTPVSNGMGFNQQSIPQTVASENNQDGSYFIRPQLRPALRNPTNSFRSEQSAGLRTGNGGLPAANINGNGDLAGERANRLLPTVSSLPARSSVLSKEVPASSNVPVQKNEQTQVPANSALPLSSLKSLRPQSHGNSPYYKQEATLEQMINHRTPDKFLGYGFIQQQLMQQKGENKFLSVYGKEEREVNGTVEVKKNGLVNANLEEVKDGKFTVMDRNHKKVGDVNLHRDVEKHLRMTENNGITNVELEKNSNAELNVERDVNLGPRLVRKNGQYKFVSQPNQHVKVHLEQNQNSRANVEISKPQPVAKTTPQPDNNRNNRNDRNDRNDDRNDRYRRDVTEVNSQLNLTELQRNPFIQKASSVLSNIGEKLKNAMGGTKSKVCQVLVNQSQNYNNKLQQFENKPPIDINQLTNNSSQAEQMSPEEQGKMKTLFNNIQKNTFRLINGLANKAIVMLKNCSDVKSSDQVYNGPIDPNSQVTQLPNGQNAIIVDTTTAQTENSESTTVASAEATTSG